MGSRALLRSTYELRLELTKCPPPKYESSVRLFFWVKRYSLRRLPPKKSGRFAPRIDVSTKCGVAITRFSREIVPVITRWSVKAFPEMNPMNFPCCLPMLP